MWTPISVASSPGARAAPDQLAPEQPDGSLGESQKLGRVGGAVGDVCEP